jgi:hypothetical protein
MLMRIGIIIIIFAIIIMIELLCIYIESNKCVKIKKNIASKQNSTTKIVDPFFNELRGSNVYNQCQDFLPRVEFNRADPNTNILYYYGLGPEDVPIINQKNPNLLDGKKVNIRYINYFTIISKKVRQPIFSAWGRNKGEDFGCDCNFRAENPEIDKACASAGGDGRRVKKKCCSNPGSKFNMCQNYPGIGQKGYASSLIYKTIPFTKGHIVANEDMSLFNCGIGIGIQQNLSCGFTTYSLCNVSPQNYRLNNDTIGKIEKYIRDEALRNNVVIFKGPVVIFNDENPINILPYGTKDSIDAKDINNYKSDEVPANSGNRWYGDSKYYTPNKEINDGNLNSIYIADGFYFLIIYKDTGKCKAFTVEQESINDPELRNGKCYAGKDAYYMIKAYLETMGITLPENIIPIDCECPL